MKREHHQMVEKIADEIMRYYVTHAPLGYTRKENEIKKSLSPLARKIKEQQKEISNLKLNIMISVDAHKDEIERRRKSDKEVKRLEKRMVEAQHQATKAWSEVEELREQIEKLTEDKSFLVKIMQED